MKLTDKYPVNRNYRKRIKRSKLDTIVNYMVHICQSKIDNCDPLDDDKLIKWMKELRQWSSVGYSAVKDAKLDEIDLRLQEIEKRVL